MRLRDYLDEPVDLWNLYIEGVEFDVLPDIACKLHNVDRLIAEPHLLRHNNNRLSHILDVVEKEGVHYDLYDAPWVDGSRQPPFNLRSGGY